jgi:hypothetical protein
MPFKNVKVTLHHIKNDNTGEDPGDELEIYGRIDVARLAFNPEIGEIISLDAKNLFARADDNTVDIPQGQQFPVNSFHDLTIRDGEFLQVSASLSDQDTFGPNDHLGSLDFRLPFNQIKTEALLGPDGQDILFQESDQRVRVKMSTVVTGAG